MFFFLFAKDRKKERLCTVSLLDCSVDYATNFLNLLRQSVNIAS